MITPYGCFKYKNNYKNNYKNTISDYKTLLPVIGFITGIVFFCCTADMRMYDYMVINREDLSRLPDFEYGRRELLLYIMGKRIKELLLAAILTTCTIKKFIVRAIYLMFGFGTGIIFTAYAYYYGFKGILLSSAIVFPHSVFYLIVCHIMFHDYDSDITDYMRFTNENSSKISRTGSMYIEKLKKIVTVLLLFAVGAITETYVSPLLLKAFSVFM